jgi:hypothetical protein
MDCTLLVLLAEAWKTGEPGDVAAMVDRIKEAPAELCCSAPTLSHPTLAAPEDQPQPAGPAP